MPNTKSRCAGSRSGATRFIPQSFFRLAFLLFAVFSSCAVLSCATLSPVDGARHFPSRFNSALDILPVWEDFPSAGSGVSFFSGSLLKPEMRFYAVRIDLLDGGLRIAVSGGENGKSMRVSSFVRNGNLIAGINALPFAPVSAREGEPRENIGIVVSDGEFVSQPDLHFDALVFYRDGSAAVKNQAEITEEHNIENAVGGFYRILEEGRPAARVSGLRQRHPRSAAGISQDGRFLYLLVIDGRQPASIGATEEETALVLLAMGAGEGINLDGGGSTSLALRFPDGRVRPVNTPIHNRIPGLERAVAGSIGVGLTEK